ncbi:hypothetical protein SSPSH_003695 [Salinisphaera shabanensis E1L3A]|uniref:Uncharacterized protein n=1 Tax=Salinisphaera shabanensis E1L3A TaxID=1033802 RepID=U2FSR4_9GAMM|nr:hypothetical protein [Salinisphaera shabanensis]ERJ17483.1 hypothetical protein SSPSH_003695 [Salinisphaera shabanensis E1L3A]
MSKKQLYKDLLERMDLALLEEFYMEACWIQYAIIEDRFNSVIRNAYPENGTKLLKTLRGLDRKLEQISGKIHEDDHDCLKTVHKELLKRIKNWKNKRNTLMHEIAETDDLAKVQRKLKILAPEGKKLVNELSARVWKYKKLVERRSS